MRALTWLWIGFLLLCFFLDGATYFVIRNRLRTALETGLDSALVAAVVEDDLSWEKNLMNQRIGEEAGLNTVKDNLGPSLAPITEVTIDLSQQGEKIGAKGTIEAQVPLFLLKIIGKSGKMRVTKSMNYMEQYK